jgi:hypothetical protein
MSNNTNTDLIERASEVCTYFEGTDLETAIHNNIERGDLETVWHLVREAEAEMARQEFFNSNILDSRDEY